MPNYTPYAIIDIILILVECRRNYRTAARLYRERYPARRHPTYTVLRNCFQRTRQGQLVRFRAQPNSSETVRLTVVAVNPNISVQEISRIHDISCSIEM